MSSHGFIPGSRKSDEKAIAQAVCGAGKTVKAKRIEIYFFDKNEWPMNTLVKFDCHNDDGSANLDRVKALAAALKKNVTDVTWGEPVIIAEHACS